MTRLTLSAVIADMNIQFADNTTGAITPAKLRGVVQNAIDSLNTVAAYSAGTPAAVSVPLTTAASRLPVTFYTLLLNDDISVIEARATPNSDILCKTAIGQLLVSMNISVAAANNADFRIYIYRNAAPLPFQIRFTGSGATNVQTTDFSWIIGDPAVNDTYTIWASSISASDNLIVSGIAIRGLMFPTLN